MKLTAQINDPNLGRTKSMNPKSRENLFRMIPAMQKVFKVRVKIARNITIIMREYY